MEAMTTAFERGGVQLLDGGVKLKPKRRSK
jgi:hypothetical protein